MTDIALTPTPAPTSVAAADPGSSRRLRATGLLARMEVRLLLRDAMVTVSLIGFAIALVLVLGGVFGDMPDPEFGGVAPDDHYVIGYVGVVLAALGLITIPVHLATHRDSGVLRRYRAAGLSTSTILTSVVAVGAVVGTCSAAVVLGVGAAVYGLDAPADLAGFVMWFLAGLACFVAIGALLGSVLRNGRAANAVGNLLWVPMFLLGGGGPPREVMTGAMQTISDALPLTHVIGGLRESWLGTTADPHNVWWVLAVTAVAGVLAVRAGRRIA